jgi:hypothetical protein
MRGAFGELYTKPPNGIWSLDGFDTVDLDMGPMSDDASTFGSRGKRNPLIKVDAGALG